ncbi:MAG: DbpA RNA binding domain-containing protein, partial [Ginsengibacter sp.]
RLDIPSGKDVCRKQFFHFMDKLISADISSGDYETYMPDLAKKFADISKEDVLKRVAALEFDHFLKYYENADDLNVKIDRDRRVQNTNVGSERRERPVYQRDGGYTKLYINLGTKDGFYKASFLQFILDESNLKKEVLGRIDLRDMNAWVEVDKSAASKMIKSLDGKNHNGRQVRMNEADGGGSRKPPHEGRKRIAVRDR